jgi:hypothetical protein
MAGPVPALPRVPAVQSLREEVPCEDPLHRVMRPDVKCHPDRVRIITQVIQACGQRHPAVFGDDEPQPKLRCHDGAGIHYRLNLCLVRPKSAPGPVSSTTWRGVISPDEGRHYEDSANALV